MTGFITQGGDMGPQPHLPKELQPRFLDANNSNNNNEVEEEEEEDEEERSRTLTY